MGASWGTYTYTSTIESFSGSFIAQTGSVDSVSGSTPTYTEDSALTFIDDSYVFSTADTFTGNIGNTAISLSISLTCSTGALLTITHSIGALGANPIPAWISVDGTGSFLVGTTPSAPVEVIYVFYVESSSIAWRTPYQKQVSITVSA